MYEALYQEFGTEVVRRMRRELTAKNGSIPTYPELLAALYLQQGPPNTASSPTAPCESRLTPLADDSELGDDGVVFCRVCGTTLGTAQPLDLAVEGKVGAL